MKKLLLATSLVAMSSTAMAANTSVLLDTAVTDTLTVTAKYVTPIAVALDTSTIDFGDVYQGKTVTDVPVVATVGGEAGETFTYSVTDDGTSFLALGGQTSGTKIDFETTTTSQKINFTVGVDTTTNTAINADFDETVTINVNYDAIAG